MRTVMITPRTLYLTCSDMKKLRLLLAGIPGVHMPSFLRKLEDDLGDAIVCTSDAVPVDVITLNSRFRMRDLESGERRDYVLGFPSQRPGDPSALSILTPVGAGLVGRRAGSAAKCETPGGDRHFEVEEIIYQPEAEGIYDD